MDDFLTKPIVQAELERVLAKVVAGAYAKNEAPKENNAAAAGGMDFTLLRGLTDTGIGPGMIVELGRIFAESAPRRMLDLRAAIARGDCAAAHLAVHSLRGMCAQMGASALAKRYVDLEQSAKAGALYAVARHVDSVDGELVSLIEELTTWVKNNEQAPPERAAHQEF
jgi:HPt (histidine-containing phosphotransfer) domain-containing protein